MVFGVFIVQVYGVFDLHEKEKKHRYLSTAPELTGFRDFFKTLFDFFQFS